MTGTIQVKKGYLYAVINYKDEAGKTKYKWIATGLKERGNRKAVKEILLDKALVEFEQQQKNKQEKIERRQNPKKPINPMLQCCFRIIALNTLRALKTRCLRKFTRITANTT